MVQEIEINSVPDELYNLTQLADVTLAAGKLSTTNIHQIKNYIQQNNNNSYYNQFERTFCFNNKYQSSIQSHQNEQNEFYPSFNTASAVYFINSATTVVQQQQQQQQFHQQTQNRDINFHENDSNKNLTDLDKFKLEETNLNLNENWKNYHHWSEKNQENFHQFQQQNSVIQHSVIKAKSSDKELNLSTISSASSSPSLSSISTTSSVNGSSLNGFSDDETNSYIYSHKIFDRKKSRNYHNHRSQDSQNPPEKIVKNELVIKNVVLQQNQDVIENQGDRSLDLISPGLITKEDKVLNIVNGEESHVCPECGKKYSTSSNLARHRQTHRSLQDKKARKCEFCDKVYVSMPAYSMHVRTHNQGCKCIHCGKCFSRPWLLQGHIRTHTGEKPFKCSVCPKAFADKSNLRAHIQTHSNTKPHTCLRCGKAFALKSYLYKHEESSCMKNHPRQKSTDGLGLSSSSLTSSPSLSSSSSSSDEQFKKKISKKPKKFNIINEEIAYSNHFEPNHYNDNHHYYHDYENNFKNKNNNEITIQENNHFSRTSVIRKTVIEKIDFDNHGDEIKKIDHGAGDITTSERF